MIWTVIGSLVGGMAIGALFAAHLWSCVRGLSRRQHPLAFVLGTSALRVAGVLIALHLLTAWAPLALASAMSGFVLLRAVWGRFVIGGAEPAR